MILIFLENINASNNRNYLLEHYKQNESFNKNTSKQYKDFFEAYQKSLTTYKSEISQYWKDIEITSNYKYVHYSNNFKQRIILDYKNSSITIQVISKDAKIAQDQIVRNYKKLFILTNRDIFRDELVLRNTYRTLRIIYDTPTNNDLVIGEFIDDKYKANLIEKVSLEEYKEKTYKHYKYFTSTYKLPKGFKNKNEKRYINIIKKHAYKSKIKYSIFVSMIKIKTAFNPYAIDINANFGLMKINANDIGLKAYFKLYKDKRILDASYLYNLENHFEIASTYFTILYFDKFKNIKNKQSRLYLCILAYEIGTENTLKLFEDTQDINSLNSSMIYKKILKKLKDRKLRIYFSKVTRLML